MSKTRKILSIVLALAMIVSTFAVTAFAGVSYESEDNAGKYNQTWALSEPVDNGDGTTFTVDVSLTTDYLTGAIQFVLTNTDVNAVEYTGIELGEAIPEDYNADIWAEEIVNDNTSRLKVMIIPSSIGVETITAEEIDGVIASITYTLVDGSADITLEDDAASETNSGGTLIAARVSDGNLVTGDAIVGQDVVIDVATVTIGSGEVILPADLAKKAGAEAGILIDTTHTFGGAYDGVVFGFTQAATNTFKNTTYLKNAFEATNEGDLSIVASDGKTTAVGNYGTGTVITVTGKDGGVKKYVVVIFGDVDGNGLVNVYDTNGVKKAVNTAGTYADNSVQLMAANCQNIAADAMMHKLNVYDTNAVKKHVNGTKLDQAALATNISTLGGTYYK